MKITKLHIENFRGFRGTHDIEFSDSNIHAIVGVNGAGKTSILDALELFLTPIVERIIGRGVNRTELLQSEKNINVNERVLKLDCFFEWKKYEILSAVNRYVVREWSPEKDENYERLLALFKGHSNDHPILIYYRSNRSFVSEARYSEKSILNYGTRREHAFKDCMNAKTDFFLLFHWHIEQINIENSEKINRNDLNYESPIVTSINSALSSFLTHMNDESLDKIKIELSSKNRKQIFFINKSSGKIEFDQLSSGEKMVIGMVLDIAYRMSIANPQLENPLISEGIVLIDELEQHLHPKWQMSILKALTATFPNVQFIVTTHSPLVINQLKNDQLSILDDFKIIPGKEVHKVYGRDVNAIIEDFMGASHRPLDVKALMNDIEKLLDDEDPNTERARKKLDELKAIIDPNDYEVIKLETQIVMEEDETH